MASGVEVTFVMNAEYTQRLVDIAAEDTSTPSEPAYRLLQILTHTRGGKLTFLRWQLGQNRIGGGRTHGHRDRGDEDAVRRLGGNDKLCTELRGPRSPQCSNACSVRLPS